jgi:lipoprotein-anchoring transpeptidase ErfK/SrfK
MRWWLPPALLALFFFATPVALGETAIGQGCGDRALQLGGATTAYAAYANGPVQVVKEPGGPPGHSFASVNKNGVRTVFGVLAVIRDSDCRALWYRVQLPVRPNGATGFVAANAVMVRAVRTRLDVDLSKRRLSFFRDGRLVLTATAGVGAPGTPTPTGRYYVNQRLHAPDPSGPYGLGGIGISAFSPVLIDWAQGGPIAIHGTNDPSSVGRTVSHGCIRIENRLLRRLFRATESGSPVYIHA